MGGVESTAGSCWVFVLLRWSGVCNACGHVSMCVQVSSGLEHLHTDRRWRLLSNPHVFTHMHIQLGLPVLYLLTPRNRLLSQHTHTHTRIQTGEQADE